MGIIESAVAYRDAVTAINAVSANPRPTVARQDLTALKELINLLLAKLPEDQPDYTTEGFECDGTNCPPRAHDHKPLV